MTAKLTRSWWVCLSDMHGNVRHVPVGDLLESYRDRLLAGTEETLPVALADSLESSQEAGRIVKRQIAAAREKKIFTAQPSPCYGGQAEDTETRRGNETGN